MYVRSFVRWIRHTKKLSTVQVNAKLRVNQTKNKHKRATHKRTLHDALFICHFILSAAVCARCVWKRRRQQTIRLVCRVGQSSSQPNVVHGCVPVHERYSHTNTWLISSTNKKTNSFKLTLKNTNFYSNTSVRTSYHTHTCRKRASERVYVRKYTRTHKHTHWLCDSIGFFQLHRLVSTNHTILWSQLCAGCAHTSVVHTNIHVYAIQYSPIHRHRQADSLGFARSQHIARSVTQYKHKHIIRTNTQIHTHKRSSLAARVVVGFVYALLKLHLVCLVSCQSLCDRHTRKFKTSSSTVALYEIFCVLTLSTHFETQIVRDNFYTQKIAKVYFGVLVLLKPEKNKINRITDVP